MSAGPRATLSLRQFCLPRAARKTLQRPDHLQFLAERRYKNPRLFVPGMFIAENLFYVFGTGVVEVKGEVNAASEPPETQFH